MTLKDAERLRERCALDTAHWMLGNVARLFCGRRPTYRKRVLALMREVSRDIADLDDALPESLGGRRP